MNAHALLTNAFSMLGRWCVAMPIAAAIALGGCGGSGPRDQAADATSPTFHGTVINDDGTVALAAPASARAASGAQRSSTGVSGSANYTLDASALQGPYIVSNSAFSYGGGGGGPASLSLQTGLVNITPLTNLQTQVLFGLASTPTIFNGFGSTAFPASMVTADALKTAQAKVLAFIQNTLGVTVASGLGDFVTSNFTAKAGDPMFDTLTSLAARKQVLGASYDTLVATFVNEAHLCLAQKITVTVGSATAVDFCPSTRSANRESADPTIVDAAFTNQAGAVLTVRVRDTVVLGATYQLANAGTTYSCTGNACAITVSAADATTGGLPLTFVQSPLAATSGSAVLSGTLLSAQPAPAPAPLPCPTTAAPVTLTVGGVSLNDFCPASVAAPAETADPTIIDASFTDATGSVLTVRVQNATTVLGATYVSASGFSYACSSTACAITVGAAASSGALPLTFAQSTLIGATDTAVVNGTLLSAVPGAASGAPACLANASSFELTVGGSTAVFCPSSKASVRETADQTIVDATIGNAVGALTVRFHSDTAVIVDATYVDTSSNSYACTGSACAITAGTPDATTGTVPLAFAGSVLTGSAGTAVFDGAVSTATPPALLPTLSCTTPYQYFFVLPNQSVVADCIQDQGSDYGYAESGYIGNRQGHTDQGFSTFNTFNIGSRPHIYVTLNGGAIASITTARIDSSTGAVTLDYKCRGADCNGVKVGPATTVIDSNFGVTVTNRAVTFTNTKLAMVGSDGALSTSVYATLSGNFTTLELTLQDAINQGLQAPISDADCAAFSNKVLTTPSDESYVYGSCPGAAPIAETLQKASGGLRLSFPPTSSTLGTLFTGSIGYVVVDTDGSGSVHDVAINFDGNNIGSYFEYWGCSGNCSGVTVSAPDSSGNYTVTFSNALMHYIEPDGFPTGTRTATVNGTFVAPPPTPGVVIASARSQPASRRRLMLPQTVVPSGTSRAASGVQR